MAERLVRVDALRSTWVRGRMFFPFLGYYLEVAVEVVGVHPAPALYDFMISEVQEGMEAWVKVPNFDRFNTRPLLEFVSRRLWTRYTVLSASIGFRDGDRRGGAGMTFLKEGEVKPEGVYQETFQKE